MATLEKSVSDRTARTADTHRDASTVLAYKYSNADLHPNFFFANLEELEQFLAGKSLPWDAGSKHLSFFLPPDDPSDQNEENS